MDNVVPFEIENELNEMDEKDDIKRLEIMCTKMSDLLLRKGQFHATHSFQLIESLPILQQLRPTIEEKKRGVAYLLGACKVRT